MSVVGLVVTLVFVRYSAPDLALTQIAVEVVTIVLLLLALRYLPRNSAPVSSPARRARDAALALAAGGGLAALAHAMLTRPFATISGFHLAEAVPGGGGANAVNVILVDFRGFDTLGEIAVLAMAALGVEALLGHTALHPVGRVSPPPHTHRSVMLDMLMRPLLPLALVVSLYLLLRGHQAPGGGFIAGLVTAIALLLQYLASGIAATEQRLALDHPRLLAAGLALALAVGAASFAFAHPFLTSSFVHLHLPVLGEFELASAMVFDVGVYLVVVAAVMLALTRLGAPGRRGEATGR